MEKTLKRVNASKGGELSESANAWQRVGTAQDQFVAHSVVQFWCSCGLQCMLRGKYFLGSDLPLLAAAHALAGVPEFGMPVLNNGRHVNKVLGNTYYSTNKHEK